MSLVWFAYENTKTVHEISLHFICSLKVISVLSFFICIQKFFTILIFEWLKLSGTQLLQWYWRVRHGYVVNLPTKTTEFSIPQRTSSAWMLCIHLYDSDFNQFVQQTVSLEECRGIFSCQRGSCVWQRPVDWPGCHQFCISPLGAHECSHHCWVKLKCIISSDFSVKKMLLQILEIPPFQHTPSLGNIPALIFYSHKEYNARFRNNYYAWFVNEILTAAIERNLIISLLSNKTALYHTHLQQDEVKA